MLHLWGEVESTIFGNVVATFPSYWLNRKWAWGKHGRSHFMKEVVPFWVMAALGIAFSIVGAALARHIAIKYNLDHFETTVLVLVANVVVVRHLLGRQDAGVQPPVPAPSSTSSTSTSRRKSKRSRKTSNPADGGGVSAAGRPGGQSRKLSNCRGIPKSSALHCAITSWRSSRFLPVTRSWSPWVWEDTPLRPRSLMNLFNRFAWSDEMPARMDDLLAGRALLGLLDLAVLERLERDLALDQLLVQHLVQGAEAVLGRGRAARARCR